jgi:hypothetical protein
MSIHRRSFLQALAAAPLFSAEDDLPDIRSVPPDLTVPTVTTGEAAPGKRVRQTDPEFAGTDIHHALYLPTDWRAGKLHPVIVEYAGNGNYRNRYGDVSTGEVEGSKLGYGISGGKRFHWISMPFVNSVEKKNQTRWWGDVEATVRYCRNTVRRVCERYGGDPSAVILAGFSRGAIGCNYIGLHDDRIAALWLAFLPYSHYDGVITTWPYPGADRASALQRLRRLKGRAVFVCQEKSIDNTKSYLESTGVKAPFTFQRIAFRNHNDAWMLRDIPARHAARRWLRHVLKTRPGA